jgi:repressor LexA
MHNLKKLRNELGMTQEAFAASLELGTTAYNNYEKGIRDPQSEFWVKVSKKYNVSTDFLLGITDEKYINTADFETSTEERAILRKMRLLDDSGRQVADFVINAEYNRAIREKSVSKVEINKRQYNDVKCYNMAASAGNGDYIGDNADFETIRFPADEVPEGTSYCIKIDGDSMEPDFDDGDIVFVKASNNGIEVGEVGIFVINGDSYIKRLGKSCLISENKKYNPIKFKPSDSVFCEGKVLGKAKILK